MTMYHHKMVNIYLIRHGQDEDNAHNILNGHRDRPLTDIGIGQAEEIAAKVKATGKTFDAVYTSPLQRAARTAEIVSQRLQLPKPIIEPRLIERDFGVMSGAPIDSIEERCAPDILHTATITYFLKADAAETFPQVLKRAQQLIADLQRKHTEGNILLVTHGDVGKMIYAAYYGLDWLDTLKLFHFGNSEMLELSPNSSADDPHVHKIPQHNL